jgi:hypothetical protein
MKRNLYFENQTSRSNSILDLFTRVFKYGSDNARLVLEVLIRKKMGERYFSITSAASISLFLIIVPLLAMSGSQMVYAWLGDMNYRISESKALNVLYMMFVKFSTWIVFTVLFIKASIKRYKEVRRKPGEYNFNKYSKYSGDINPIFWKYKLFNIEPSFRTIRTFYEPLPFFIIGLILIFAGQIIGYLLFYCSIIYSIANIGSIWSGNNYVLDIIDRKIIANGAKDAFVNETHPQEAEGLEFFCDFPEDKEKREDIANRFEEEAYVSFVY